LEKSYYKEYYELERNHWWFKVRSKIIEDQIIKYAKLPSNPKILNVGAATFYSSEMLQQYGNVVSLEYDENCVDFVRSTLNVDIVQGSATDLKFEDKTFDLVCAFDVIEHIDNHSKAISEMRRVLKSSGKLIITVPAFMSLWSSHDEVNHHFRRYTKISLSKVLKLNKNEIEVVRFTYFNSLLFVPILLARKLGNFFYNKRSITSDFSFYSKSKLLNRMFGLIFAVERTCLNYTNFPIGVSILYIESNELK